MRWKVELANAGMGVDGSELENICVADKDEMEECSEETVMYDR